MTTQKNDVGTLISSGGTFTNTTGQIILTYSGTATATAFCNSAGTLVLSPGALSISSAESATPGATTAGAARIAGGCAIGGNIVANGNVAAGSSTTSGTVNILGGCRVRDGTIYSNNASTNPGLILAYNGTNEVSFGVSSVGDLTIDAAGNDLNLSSTDLIHVLNTTASTSTSTGALIVAGGLGVANSLFMGGNLSVAGTTASLTTTTGSIITAGGLGVAGKACANTIYADTKTIAPAHDWTVREGVPLGGGVNSSDITVGPDKVVVVSAATQSYYSLDGLNWVQSTSTFTPNLTGVTYNQNTGVYCAMGPLYTYTSTNGTTWVEHSAPAIGSTKRMVCDGVNFYGMMPVIGRPMYSSNGINWINATGGTLDGISDIDVDIVRGIFVIVSSLALSNADILRSIDGKNYTKISGALPVSSLWRGINYGGGVWIANSSDGIIARSVDNGISFTQVYSAGAGVILNQSYYYNPRGRSETGGVWVLVIDSADNYMCVSLDGGLNWAPYPFTSSSNRTIIAYRGMLITGRGAGDPRYINIQGDALDVIGNADVSGGVYGEEARFDSLLLDGNFTGTSTSTGTLRVIGGAGITGAAHIGRVLVDNIDTAFDDPLESIRPVTIGSHTYYNSCIGQVAGVNTLVAVAYDGYILTMSEPFTGSATEQTVQGANAIYGVAYGAGKFYAVYNDPVTAGGTALIWSADGLTWNTQADANLDTKRWNTITFAGDRFIICRGTTDTVNGLATSTNGGTTWSLLTTPLGRFTNADYNPITGTWIADGAGGYVIRSTDGGATWASLANPVTPYAMSYISFGNPNNVPTWIGSVTNAGGAIPCIYYSRDDGTSWTAATGPDVSLALAVYRTSYANGIFLCCIASGAKDILYSWDGAQYYSDLSRGTGSRHGVYVSGYWLFPNSTGSLRVRNGVSQTLGVNGSVDIARNLWTNTLESYGSVVIDDMTPAVSASTGAFQVAGGAAIRGNLYVGGTINGGMASLSITGTTASTSTSTGALIVVGGAGIGGTVTASTISVAGTTASTSTSTGALTVAGGIGFGGTMNGYAQNLDSGANLLETVPNLVGNDLVTVAGAWITCAANDTAVVAFAAGSANIARSVYPFTSVSSIAVVSATWSCVSNCGGDNFIAVATTGEIYKSVNSGASWAAITNSGYTWGGVGYGNGVTIIFDFFGGRIIRSTDLVNWTEIALPASFGIYNVRYCHGSFYIIGVGLLRSDDLGLTWYYYTPFPLSTTVKDILPLTIGTLGSVQDYLIAVYITGSLGVQQIYAYSGDLGTTWTDVTGSFYAAARYRGFSSGDICLVPLDSANQLLVITGLATYSLATITSGFTCKCACESRGKIILFSSGHMSVTPSLTGAQTTFGNVRCGSELTAKNAIVRKNMRVMNDDCISYPLYVDGGLLHNRRYQDLQLAGIARATGSTAPGFIEIDTTGLFAFSMTGGKILYANTQLPHGATGVIRPHIHWMTSNTVGPVNVTWILKLAIYKPNTGTGSTIINTNLQLVGVNLTQYVMRMDSWSAANVGSTYLPSTIIAASLELNTYTGAGSIFVMGWDLHYEANREGTETETNDD